jgi:hypothetical protein
VAADTPFRKSWGLYFQQLLLMWVLGAAFAYGGFYLVQVDELVLKILGGCMLISGPFMVLGAPFFPRPGFGNCPACGHKLVNSLSTSGDPLLCPSCAAYARVNGDRLALEAINATGEKPIYAAALPWDDIAGEKKGTIAFSAQDYLTDKAQDWMTKNKGVRVLDQWPQLCCVCGGRSARTADHAVNVLLMGSAKGVLAAKAVPYCAQHSEGVEFGMVDYAMGILSGSAAPHSFGIKFRSHAFREGFRKLNPYKFPTEAAGPLKIRKIPA